MTIMLAHGPDCVAVGEDGQALDGSDYVAFFGIAPMAVREATEATLTGDREAESSDPLGWAHAAHLVGRGPCLAPAGCQERIRPALSTLVAEQGVLSFAESAALARDFLAAEGASCLEGARVLRLWAVKEGPTASVWCVETHRHRLALNVARDHSAARDLAASAPRLAATAAVRGRNAVAEPIAQAWMGQHFVLVQRWIEDSHELGLCRERSNRTAVLARIERFLTGGSRSAGMTGVRGWPYRGSDVDRVINGIAEATLDAVAAGVAVGLGATGLSIGQGDFVMTPECCAIVACNGPPLSSAQPDALPNAAELAAALLSDLSPDRALKIALTAALDRGLVRGPEWLKRRQPSATVDATHRHLEAGP